jgi:hypothetical protein
MKYPTIDVTTTSKDRTALAKPGLGASVKAEKNNTLPTYNKIANEMSHPYPRPNITKFFASGWHGCYDSIERTDATIAYAKPGDHSNDDLEIVLALLKQAKADEKIMTEANDFVIQCGIPIYQLIL